MSTELRCYQYVNRPFDAVRDALVTDAVGVFERATGAAGVRANAIVSQLKTKIAGFEVGKNVVVRVKSMRNAEPPPHTGPEALRLELEWQAETSAALFPSMRASLLVYPLSATETQLDLHGTYEPPGGVLGSAADRIVGHRIATATVLRFLDEVAARLGTELAA